MQDVNLLAAQQPQQRPPGPKREAGTPPKREHLDPGIPDPPQHLLSGLVDRDLVLPPRAKQTLEAIGVETDDRLDGDLLRAARTDGVDKHHDLDGSLDFHGLSDCILRIWAMRPGKLRRIQSHLALADHAIRSMT
jgi:hypothetical protein